ncbi:MAG: S41 family peptidase [Deltaproteobacteria bacterium]|nr:S41 family peptidase [Deltaproteobacteria bacterium]
MKKFITILWFIITTSGAHANLYGFLGDEPEEYSLKEMKYFNWTTLNIVERYVDQKRINPFEMFKAALRGIEKAVPELVVKFNEENLEIELTMGEKRITKRLEKKPTVIWENTLLLRWVFEFVDMNVKERRKLYEVEFSAINEMLSELDPHSNFLNASQCNELRISTAGKFGGLGIIIQSKNGYITVVSPIKGTPAHRAGIKSGDRIIRIDDESAINMTLDQAVNRLRGEPGTKVTIYIIREDWPEPKKMVLTREEIKTRSIDKILLTDEKTSKKIAYIKVNGFSEETYQDVRKAFNTLKEDARGQLAGLILDLRNNPGGLLDASVKVSDMFLKSGVIVTTRAKDGEKEDEKNAYEDRSDIDLPMAVLINRGSASASEIVAGALKDNNRAIIIGQTSFGKGSVQILFDRLASKDEIENMKDLRLTQPLKDCLKLTIAEYMTPRDVSIQSIGITPDVYLVPQIVQKYSMNMYYFPRYSSEVKLEKHLESSRPPEDKPFVILPYVLERESQDEEEDNDTYESDIKEDFEMRFAKEIIANTKGNTRLDLIETAKRLRDKHYVLESKKFFDILKTRGIDFSEGESNYADVEVEVSYKLIHYKSQKESPKKESKKEEKTVDRAEEVTSGVLKAGNDYFFTFKAKNKSTKPIYRLSGIIESHDPTLNGKEIFWGYIPAGKEKEYNVLVKFSKSFPRVAIPYRVRLLLSGKYLEKSFEYVAKVDSLLQPKYVFSYLIRDNGENSNKNGKIEKGETITIKTELKNMGEGDVQNTRISLQNQSGKVVYLKEGLCNIASLKKGETAECIMQFIVREKSESDLKFKLFVTDDTFYDESSTSLKIPFGKPMGDSAKGTVDLPTIKIISAPELKVVEDKNAEIIFSVFNLKGGEDIYVRSNEDKVFYIKNSLSKSQLENIKTSVPLKEGFNNVYVFVRVNDDQYVYKRVVITTPKKFEPNDIIASQN